VFFGVTFTSDARFDRATFTSDARFDRATFTSDARFDRATFTSGALFVAAIFTGDAWFGEATFTGGALFVAAIFTGGAWFGEATFTGDVKFVAATFTGDAGFGRATFTGDAWFDRATFTSGARFGEATFTGDARFGEATFTGDAWFDRGTFTSGAGFGGVTFKRLANFEGVRFEQARQFGPLLAYRGLVLDDVQFAEPVQIEVSSTGVCCRRARFPGGVQFRLRWARVVLDDTDLAAPSILAGIPRLPDEILDEVEERIARAWRRLLGDEISERPQLLSLRRANVAGLALSNVSADHCRFDGAHNLDKLRLESGVTFAAAALPARLAGRQVIAEERAWRARRSRRWSAPMWPGWLGDEPGVLDPGQVAGLYRALRKGREDSKDEPGAADFYYGEMEMRRRARRTQNPGQQAAALSGGAAERAILTAYWLVSGYSLRAWRAVAALAVVTALFAVAFHEVGFAVPPGPASYWTSLLYAFRATLSLSDDGVKLTAWGQLLQGILRLTGPVLLGLALLALRNRVKR
jgi:uncharacterized protein YjbI with pentapeptide repeats